MKKFPTLSWRAAMLAVLCLLGASCATRPDAMAHVHQHPHLLTGTWQLVAADAVRPDGVHIRDYGEDPKGLLLVDATGRYSLQIFKSERPQFASTNKAEATPSEYRSAVMGSSTHFGSIDVDAGGQTLTFNIVVASFPNWQGTRQIRHFELKNDVLSYEVPARPDGNVPISVWRRIDSS